MHRCKICQSDVSHLVDLKKKLSYYRCATCGFVYLDEESIVDVSTERKHYEKHNNSLECQGYVEMFEKFIEEVLSPYMNRIQTVLDFGCGEEAVLAHLLKKESLEVDIYDIYFYPKKIYQNRAYDLIVSTEVFEHLKEPKSVLKELVESLKLNGYMVLMTKFPPVDDKEFLAWWYRRDITHISFFTPQSFEILAKEVALTVVKTMNDNIVVLQKC